MTAEDRAAHVEREAVAGGLAVHATFGWNGDRHHACRCGAHLNDKTWADPLPRWALHVADAVLAALPQTGDAAAVARVAALIDSDLWRETPCGCGHRADLHRSDPYGPSVCIGGLGLCSCDWTWPRIVEARLRAALTAGADQ